MTVEVRAAVPADLDGIVAVFLGCWRRSYAGLLHPVTIKDMTDDRAIALWQRVLASDEGTVLVAERAGEILGVTRCAVRDAEGVVHSLYVAPQAQGLGLGTRLLDEALAAFRDQGVTTASLWVFAANAPSRGFYAARGWAPDGGTRTEEAFGEPELRLRRLVR